MNSADNMRSPESDKPANGKRRHSYWYVNWIMLGAIAIILGLLLATLPVAIMQAREEVRRVTCENNLKIIGLGFHMYNDTYQNIPAAYVVDSEDKPLHSWRTTIAWEVDGKATMQDPFVYDEPWDSPANRRLYEGYYHPDWIYCPADSEVLCSYYVVNVPGGIFEGQKISSLDRIPDGTANTLLAVENVGLDNHWLQPGDLGPPALAAKINSSYDGTVLSSRHSGGAHVVFADGRTLFLPNNTDLPTLRAIVIANDGLTLSASGGCVLR